ncbi:hypothetical protein [Priestia aryabhattai]|uniref:hypothetical protein n=1 Tax=Priestia aryabhattai TaxID=412384 RepID=UPI002E247188|nr:hypothetical protein [Priestia aryabhattai]MED4262171.1 hypothetical protein [Priestia aryabhattai]
MGFNLAEIINKFISVKVIGSNIPDGWENPLATPKGQIVTSENESWKMRLNRLGRMKTAYASNVSLTQGSGTDLVTLSPTGYVAYPTHIVISSTGPGLAYFEWRSFKGGPNLILTKYLPSAGSFELDLDGAVMVGDGGALWLRFRADNAGSLGYGSVLYGEVLT